jgi:hypothetical protein
MTIISEAYVDWSSGSPVDSVRQVERTPNNSVTIKAPTTITMRQARLQLATLGIYSAVNSAVSSMGETAQIEWEYAASVDRSNALTQAMIQMLHWSEKQADDYFLAASKL